MFSLDLFGFRANWSPYYFLSLALILIGYYLLVYKFYPRFKDGERGKRKEVVLFTVGIVILYAVKGSPLDLLGHITLYAHMIQMAVLYLVIPPLLILGLPKWLWRFILNKPGIKQMFSFMTKPLMALILFNGFFSFYHIPLVFDFVKTDMWLHAGYTTMLFIFAIAMWWPLLDVLPEHKSLSGLKKIGYIFADGVLITPACAMIIFADTPLYATYSDPNAWAQALALCVPATTLSYLNLSGPEMFSSLSLLEDQRLGGVIMKIIQEIVYGAVLTYTFYSWYRSERKKEKEELSLYRQQHIQPQPSE
ncbi:cytochrome c oxidase assembly factor CtaG [Bacillus sp. B15-48]|uniref:cytochrome c oxidase assembly factor CtaG n=1 Tax=Bacillus sp. B15-48 TaxID=1548601 RepID=UPI00193F5EF4|nr:cytochrome c oxidase assembly factor CtaG [Bacillus sp. B15-48]MBM4764061.1 cytochrome c oxidase assembly factor CtaG [Bacillus sp. B15-48]